MKYVMNFKNLLTKLGFHQVGNSTNFCMAHTEFNIVIWYNQSKNILQFQHINKYFEVNSYHKAVDVLASIKDDFLVNQKFLNLNEYEKKGWIYNQSRKESAQRARATKQVQPKKQDTLRCVSSAVHGHLLAKK